MYLWPVNWLLPTSLLPVEELVSLCWFTPVVYVWNTATLDVKGVTGNVFVDIGAWYTGFLEYLEPFLHSRNPTLIAVDPIYEISDTSQRKTILDEVKAYFRQHIHDVRNLEQKHGSEVVYPYLVEFIKHTHRVLWKQVKSIPSVVKQEVSTKNIPDASTHIVSVHHVFYAAQNPAQFLREIYRILHSSGNCIIIDYITSSSPALQKLQLCAYSSSCHDRNVWNLTKQELWEVIEKFSRFS